VLWELAVGKIPGAFGLVRVRGGCDFPISPDSV